jgi:hypothetical protein
MFKKVYVFVAVLLATLSIHSSLAQDDYQKQLAGMSGVRLLGELGMQMESLCIKGSTSPEERQKCAQKRDQRMEVENELGRREANFKFPSLWHSTGKEKQDLGPAVDEGGNIILLPGSASPTI